MHAKIDPSALQAITLRNIPLTTARRIVEKATTDEISLNKAVLRLLAESSARSARTKSKHTDFAQFAGGWDAEEADAFDRYLAEMRRIDPAGWE